MPGAVSPALTRQSRSKDHRLPCDVNVEQKVDAVIKPGNLIFISSFFLEKTEICLV